MNSVRKQKTFLLKNANRFKQKLLYWIQDKETFQWLDSNNVKGKNSTFDAVLALGVESDVTGTIPNAFAALSDFKNDLNDWIFGYLTYDLKNELEDLFSANTDELAFPDLYFFQPKKLFIFRGNRVTFYYLGAYKKQIKSDFNEIKAVQFPKSKTSDQKAAIRLRMTKDQYLQKVSSLLKHIKRGDIYEANFCQEFYSENSSIHPLETFLNLNAISRAPFTSFFKHEHFYAISASPERYLKKTRSEIISQPIKGTAKRGDTVKEDKLIRIALSQDEKERSENIMIVDLVRNDLSHTAEKGSVKVNELCKVYSFKQVHQMISTVTSKLAKDKTIYDVFKTTFPMGSMTGAPKISAMKLIELYEETKRGLYSGAIGYITPDNDFDFNVVIRSILYNARKKYISFSVGGAITAKSDPRKEYEECLIKAKAMRAVLEGRTFDKY